ncbi:hypothetical protein DJ564_06210 [Pseudomonas sp. 31-12]|uniref:hypothetical protein n=1 Tax=Pseudomonas sp. 31-12 TaxID=2201356 RepID=UPI000D6CE2DA|nr:hypothetical protein [Pseudomonas sp. 31-12]AWM90441.1 hypothetical protein DJ564_06210 [Pseudomonas sp. 31-12]
MKRMLMVAVCMMFTASAFAGALTSAEVMELLRQNRSVEVYMNDASWRKEINLPDETSPGNNFVTVGNNSSKSTFIVGYNFSVEVKPGDIVTAVYKHDQKKWVTASNEKQPDGMQHVSPPGQ